MNEAIAKAKAEMLAEFAMLKNKGGWPKPPKPDYYDGRLDAVFLNQWLSQMEEYLSFYKYTKVGNEPVRVAAFYLSSHARTWWSQLTIEQKNMNWSEFKMHLKARFYPIDHERQVLSRLEKLKQRGAVAKYIEAFES